MNITFLFMFLVSLLLGLQAESSTSSETDSKSKDVITAPKEIPEHHDVIDSSKEDSNHEQSTEALETQEGAGKDENNESDNDKSVNEDSNAEIQIEKSDEKREINDSATRSNDLVDKDADIRVETPNKEVSEKTTDSEERRDQSSEEVGLSDERMADYSEEGSEVSQEESEENHSSIQGTRRMLSAIDSGEVVKLREDNLGSRTGLKSPLVYPRKVPTIASFTKPFPTVGPALYNSVPYNGFTPNYLPRRPYHPNIPNRVPNIPSYLHSDYNNEVPLENLSHDPHSNSYPYVSKNANPPNIFDQIPIYHEEPMHTTPLPYPRDIYSKLLQASESPYKYEGPFGFINPLRRNFNQNPNFLGQNEFNPYNYIPYTRNKRSFVNK